MVQGSTNQRKKKDKIMHHNTKTLNSVIFTVMLLMLSNITSVFAQDRPLAPESAGVVQDIDFEIGLNFMAVTAHPDATKAAYDILSKGGTAADAGIAAQAVLGLVEPQSSGLGGGGFALYYNAADKILHSYDGRETAPDMAGRYLFQKEGKAMGFFEAAIGGRAVGVPGTPKLLETLHSNYGRLEWASLFTPAIDLAEQGFTVSERMHKMLVEERPRFQTDIKTFLHFYPDGKNPVAAGSKMNNPNYALSLKDIRNNKSINFYNGDIAQNIVEKAREYKSLLSIEDFSNYSVKKRNPVCGVYRGYKICSMGQPSSGGLTLINALMILENFDLRALGKDNPKSYHLIGEASRLAFADRNQYMADADFVQTPNTLLLQEDYIKKRAALINTDKALMEISHGVPMGWNNKKQMPDGTVKDSGTTHMSIMDQYGNMLSMTSSIEYAFGAHIMTNGFLLNNQLTDFSFDASDGQGVLIANRVEGGKRPRSSMTPVIIFNPEGDPYMAIGSAGGSRIIGYVLQRIIAAIDWDMDIQNAIAMPHVLHRGKKLELELSGLDFAKPLKDFGHPVLVGNMNSGLTAIQIIGDLKVGAADPRRDGNAMGD